MKILFIINGFGLGNSYRSSIIINELLSNFKSEAIEIDVLVSGNSQQYFKNYHLPISVYHQNSYNIPVYNDTSLIDGFKKTWGILKNFYYNGHIQKKLIKKNGYDLVFSDSDYSCFFWKFSSRIKIIAINNSPIVLKHIPKLFKKEYFIQILMETFEYLFYNIFSNLIICPTYTNEVIKSKNKKIVFCPFLLKNNLKDTIFPPTHRFKQIVFMSGGSILASFSKIEIQDFLRRNNLFAHFVGEEGESTDTIKYWGKIFGPEKDKILSLADILIINGGIGSVSEALALNVPTIAVPICGHFEQLVNIHTASKISDNVILSQPHMIEFNMDKIIQNYNYYANPFKKNLDIDFNFVEILTSIKA